MNSASAWLAPKSLPSDESPACNSIGWPCGPAGSVATPADVELRAVVLDGADAVGST